MAEEKKLPVLPDDRDRAAAQASELPGWWYEGRWIRRKYNTDGWLTTLALVNTIGYLAEAAYHHPDLEVTWGKVWVKLRTHSSNGVTERDFALARRIEDDGAVATGRGLPHGGHAQQVGEGRQSRPARLTEPSPRASNRIPGSPCPRPCSSPGSSPSPRSARRSSAWRPTFRTRWRSSGSPSPR